MMASMSTRTFANRSFPLLALALVVGACGSPGSAGSGQTMDASAVAGQACLAVDGAAHGDLEMAEAWDAQATDREEAAAALQGAADQDPQYEDLAAAMTVLADQTRLLADQFGSGDTDALVESLTTGGAEELTAPLLDARNACQALGLPTK